MTLFGRDTLKNHIDANVAVEESVNEAPDKTKKLRRKKPERNINHFMTGTHFKDRHLLQVQCDPTYATL